MADEVKVTMRYGRALNFGPLMTEPDARYVRAVNDNLSRALLGAPSSGGGGSGAVPPRGGIVPGIAGGVRPGRKSKANFDSGLPRAANPATQFVLSAVYLANMAGVLRYAFQVGLGTDGGPIMVTPGSPDVPANLLPQGIVYTNGPCPRWDAPGVGNGFTPIPTSDGAITPCTRPAFAEPGLTRITDAQVDTLLSSGQQIYLNAPQNMATDTARYWANYAWVGNPQGIQNPGWNSAIHGKPWPIPGTPGFPFQLVEDDFRKLLDRLGYRPFELAKVRPAYQSGRTIVIPTEDFWGWRNNHIDDRVSQGGNKEPPLPPNPPTIYDPWQPFDPNVRTVKRYTPQMRRVSRVVGKAGRGVRESKGNIAKAVSNALDVMGSLSEIGDDIDAFYKSLPASIRKRALIENGKSLNWKEKLEVLYQNVDSIKIDVAVAGMITSRVDDFVSAQIAQPLDKALQAAVPDYLTRLGVRQAIRWAYWKTGAESAIPQAPSSQRLLPEKYRQEAFSKWTAGEVQEMVSKRPQNY